MSEPDEKPASDYAPLMEVRLHRLSPFSPLVTGVLLSAILFGAYLLLASAVGQPIVRDGSQGAEFDSASWAALVISMVFAAALTMPAVSHREWCKALPELKALLDTQGIGMAEAMAVGSPRSRGREALLAFAGGAVAGLAISLWQVDFASMTPAQYFGSVRPWFDLANPVLFGLGARAGQMLFREDRDLSDLINAHLEVQIASMERHFVFGRLALRGALAWLVMTGIILLFFVDSAPVPVSVAAVGLALVAGGYVFASNIGPVVRKSAAVRDAALVEVRQHIAEAGASFQAGKPGDVPLPDLVAYEAWLEKRPVWPISAPISRRLALYGLIPVLAWFGAAAAERILDSLAG